MKSLKLFLVAIFLLVFTSVSSSQIVSSQSGNWGDASTWVGGVVPSSMSNVQIDTPHVVFINGNFSCNNLTVKGTLYFDSLAIRSLSVNGNIDVQGTFKTKSVVAGPVISTLTLFGNLIATGTLDFRNGSNPNVGVCDLTITGSGNTTINVPSNVDINGVTINKSGAGKIILASNMYQNNNSTTAPSILYLNNGKIETGAFAWHVKSTSTGAGVQGGSANSYLVGNLVRYIPTGTNLSRNFPIGDPWNYRPVTIYIPNGVSNAPISAQVITGNANTGTSIFTGAIDKVSNIRYYKFQNLFTSAIIFSSFAPSYGNDDGVTAGNQDLRVGLSVNERQLWQGIGPSKTGPRAHTTNLDTLPRFIQSDDISGGLSVASNGIFYISLARDSATVTNPLPVELKSFNVYAVNNLVSINWVTASEKNNLGFEIEKRIDSQQWEKISFIPASGTSSEQKIYNYEFAATSSGLHFFRLKQIDLDGSVSYSDEIQVDIELIPNKLVLYGNYPNPFNPTTSIEFSVPRNGIAKLSVYNSIGECIADLFNGNVKAQQTYSIKFNASPFPSGVYITTLEFEGIRKFSKMILIK
jgi:hypothetical protein